MGGRKNRGFALAKWEFCKLPSGSCRASRARRDLARAQKARQGFLTEQVEQHETWLVLPPSRHWRDTSLREGGSLPRWGRWPGGAGPEGVSFRMIPTPVSPAGSGPGAQWAPSRTDRSGNGDRFAAERHWRSLTPLPLISLSKRGNPAATGGGFLFSK